VAKDAEETTNNFILMLVGYAGAVGTCLWQEITDDQEKVCPGYGESLLTWLTWT
jgi:hypothetical protein